MLVFHPDDFRPEVIMAGAEWLLTIIKIIMPILIASYFTMWTILKLFKPLTRGRV